MMSIKDRAAGAVMGALIGDALGVGPHWYYDLAEMRRDYGEWITGYTDPRPHRYHAGLQAGQLSQAGIITTMLLRSTVDAGGYDETDFCRRLDEELFPQLDGTPMRGPGGYTSQSIREAILTGALAGAQVGLSGIPRRFPDGLENSRELTALAERLGEEAEAGGAA